MTVINFECTAITHVGSVRSNNEDNYYVNGKFKKNNNIPTEGYTDTNVRDAYIYAVCDGMGGEYFGEIASMIAVAVLAEYQDTDIRYSVMDYIDRTNNIICGEIEKHNGVRSGTTLALLYIYGNKALSINIGDSRVYLLRKKDLYLLSEDHTEAQRMVDMGVITDEEAKNHKLKNRLTQHLGIFPNEMTIEPYVSEEIKIKKGDVFLVCSDGLTDMVSDDEIRAILSQKYEDTVGIAKKLSAAADAYGGRDNTTVVVIRAT